MNSRHANDLLSEFIQVLAHVSNLHKTEY